MDKKIVYYTRKGRKLKIEINEEKVKKVKDEQEKVKEYIRKNLSTITPEAMEHYKKMLEYYKKIAKPIDDEME